MNHTANDEGELELAKILPWLVEMGADEVILNAPVNRFQVQVEAGQPAGPAKPKLRSLTPVPRWQPDLQAHEALAAAQAMAQSIQSLEDYIEVLTTFDSHPLKKTAVRPAIFMGSTEPSVLVLCDKPRNEEDRQGEVLTGNHLILATRMMSAIGLRAMSSDQGEANAAFANFIPWRPPGNRMPTEQEAKLLVPFAIRLVELLQPKAILCFGHLAGQYLAAGAEAVMRARGKWLTVAGVPLLTTFHPETLLNSPPSKRLAWHDLQAFRQTLESQP
jgi:uracil-DNA glycosylase